jgi:GDPmannose 4,6-dehydratase
MKKALITGITGQDGSYLAELLLEKGYEVHGIVRRVGFEDQEERYSRIGHIMEKVTLHWGDVSDYPTIWRLIAKLQPEEIYHLAAQSQVGISFDDNFSTFKTNIDSTHYLLSAIKELCPKCKLYFAATSEMFGQVRETPQNENTPFNPVSPYGISKLAAFELVKMYRMAYGIFACSGILFNHESPRRGFEFVTRKITMTAAKIKLGKEKELKLGNIETSRDWGFAGDYVEAMWKILQHDTPDDYVVGTGESHTIKEFLQEAFGQLGLDWQKYVVIDQKFYRPAEVHQLRADPAKVKKVLGWEPKTKFKELVKMMVEGDMEYLK